MCFGDSQADSVENCKLLKDKVVTVCDGGRVYKIKVPKIPNGEILQGPRHARHALRGAQRRSGSLGVCVP